jgi:hypothetical protein
MDRVDFLTKKKGVEKIETERTDEPQLKIETEIVSLLPTKELVPLVDKVVKRWEEECGINLESDLGIVKDDFLNPDGVVTSVDGESGGYFDPKTGLTHVRNRGHDANIGRLILQSTVLKKESSFHRTLVHEEGHSRYSYFDDGRYYYYHPDTVVQELFAEAPTTLIQLGNADDLARIIANHYYVLDQYEDCNSDKERYEKAYKDILPLSEKIFALKGLGLGSLQIETEFSLKYRQRDLDKLERSQIKEYFAGVNDIFDDLLIENCPDSVKNLSREEKIEWLNVNFGSLVRKAEESDLKLGLKMRDILLEEAEILHDEFIKSDIKDVPLKMGTNNGVVLGNITTNESGQKKVLLSKYRYINETDDGVLLTELKFLKYDPERGYTNVSDFLIPEDEIEKIARNFVDSLDPRFENEFVEAVKNIDRSYFFNEDGVTDNIATARIFDAIIGQLEIVGQSSYTDKAMRQKSKLLESKADGTISLLRPSGEIILDDEQYDDLQDKIKSRCDEWKKAFPDISMDKLGVFTRGGLNGMNWSNLIDFYKDYRQGFGEDIVNGFLSAINGYDSDEKQDFYVRAMVLDLASYVLQEILEP